MLWRSLPVVLGLALVAGAVSYDAVAQEKSKSTKSSASSKKQSDKAEASPFRRLPSGYGALKLTPEQKEKVYAVREEYGKEIEELQNQIAALREKMDKECEVILTADQKKELAAARSANGEDDESKSAKSKSATSKSSKATGKSSSKSSSKSSKSDKE